MGRAVAASVHLFARGESHGTARLSLGPRRVAVHSLLPVLQSCWNAVRVLFCKLVLCNLEYKVTS